MSVGNINGGDDASGNINGDDGASGNINGVDVSATAFCHRLWLQYESLAASWIIMPRDATNLMKLP